MIPKTTHRMILDDCLEAMRGMDAGSIDAVVTDPPFGVGLGVGNDRRGASGSKRRHGLAKTAYADSSDTYEAFVGGIVPRLNAALDLATRAAVFTGPHIQEQRKAAAIGGIYCPAGSGRHCWGFKTFLPVLFYGTAPDLNRGAKPNVIVSSVRAKKNGHPCPKPLEWMLWLVALTTRPGETVLDPFAGSGTTGVACKMLGRNFIGCENCPEYHALAEARIAGATNNLFEGAL